MKWKLDELFKLNLLKTKNMKKLIFALFLFAATSTHAQTVTKDAQGNYIAVKQQLQDTSLKATGHTYTDNKGKVFPVYISKNGKLFVSRISAKGNAYKIYLKID